MIFGRRPRSLLAKLRDVVQPRKGWRRGFEYVGRRVQRLPDTPHKIALGFACGVAISFTPLFGVHLFGGVALAWALRCNLIAAALGTLVGNPLTIPPIAYAAIRLGNRLLDANHDAAAFDPAVIFHDLDGFLNGVFWPYLAGGAPMGLAAGAASYALVRPLVAAYQARRRARLALSAKRRVEAHMPAPRPAQALPPLGPGPLTPPPGRAILGATTEGPAP